MMVFNTSIHKLVVFCGVDDLHSAEARPVLKTGLLYLVPFGTLAFWGMPTVVFPLRSDPTTLIFKLC